jgi:hypothetical protein
MVKTAPLPSLQNQMPTWAKTSALAKEWELNRLAERLDGSVQPIPTPISSPADDRYRA